MKELITECALVPKDAAKEEAEARRRLGVNPTSAHRRSACRLVCLVDAAGSFSAALWPPAVALGASESW